MTTDDTHNQQLLQGLSVMVYRGLFVLLTSVRRLCRHYPKAGAYVWK